ncbi:uncharacterized protein K489DRAFT_384423 [Dissoconium aciculare CBS 342.82]|uniref:Uncharacterized protein n=1 Tax=Dissoconium aciculare CBS 342.82 TaxID=1314786 RepID=A0A6J3LTE9_9PEZI|nr:uncharacterized protein K489DRAFT_384423 [Dissoconium aciculare CBS 342.82]KAF1818928.1 hypothetical protein K489DRAFT_384423 [Dissoconium aciculare CBS 342.82]
MWICSRSGEAPSGCIPSSDSRRACQPPWRAARDLSQLDQLCGGGLAFRRTLAIAMNAVGCNPGRVFSHQSQVVIQPVV